MMFEISFIKLSSLKMLELVKSILDAVENKTGNHENSVIEICLALQKLWITQEDAEKILKLIKARGYLHVSDYDIAELIELHRLNPKKDNEFENTDDELIKQAIRIISETRKASATLLQRQLWIWFARAAKLMDTLEERGVIGPQDGAKPRDIFI